MVNEEEAADRPADLRPLPGPAVPAGIGPELNRRGWRTKSWATKEGTFHEGVPFQKSHLSRLLGNPLYVGQVSHHGQIYDGEHPGIVDQALYDRVQALLAGNNVSGGAKAKNRYGHLLRGLLHCTACGCAMSPSVTRKNGRAFRYYVCTNATRNGWKSCPHPSLPAQQIEDAVVERIKAIGRDPELVAETLAQVRSIQKTRTPQLVAERRRLEKELDRLRDRGRDEDRDQVARVEARLAEIAEELAFLQATTIDKRHLARAWPLFDEVWGCLLPREQERVIDLLVERVDFDGERETVAITFRPTGIRSLADEVAAAQEALGERRALRVEFKVDLGGPAAGAEARARGQGRAAAAGPGGAPGQEPRPRLLDRRADPVRGGRGPGGSGAGCAGCRGQGSARSWNYWA